MLFAISRDAKRRASADLSKFEGWLTDRLFDWRTFFLQQQEEEEEEEKGLNSKISCC